MSLQVLQDGFRARGSIIPTKAGISGWITGIWIQCMRNASDSRVAEHGMHISQA